MPLNNCEYCGTPVKDFNQSFCEECGKQLTDPGAGGSERKTNATLVEPHEEITLETEKEKQEGAKIDIEGSQNEDHSDPKDKTSPRPDSDSGKNSGGLTNIWIEDDDEKKKKGLLLLLLPAIVAGVIVLVSAGSSDDEESSIVAPAVTTTKATTSTKPPTTTKVPATTKAPTTTQATFPESLEVASYIKSIVFTYDPLIGIEPFTPENGFTPYTPDVFECWLEELIDDLGIKGYESFIQRINKSFNPSSGGVSRSDAIRENNAWNACDDLISFSKEQWIAVMKENYAEEGTPFEPVDTDWVNCVHSGMSEQEIVNIGIDGLVHGENSTSFQDIWYPRINRCQYIYDDYYSDSTKSASPSTTKAPTTTRPPTTTKAVVTAPSPPRNVASSVIGKSSLKVTWQAPSSDGNSDINGYSVCWGIPGSNYENFDCGFGPGDDVLWLSASARSYTITNLNPGTRYEFFVGVANKADEINISEFVNRTIPTPATTTTKTPANGAYTYTTSLANELLGHCPVSGTYAPCVDMVNDATRVGTPRTCQPIDIRNWISDNKWAVVSNFASFIESECGPIYSTSSSGTHTYTQSERSDLLGHCPVSGTYAPCVDMVNDATRVGTPRTCQPIDIRNWISDNKWAVVSNFASFIESECGPIY